MAAFRILVVRLSSMGDVIHTLPAAASLKNSFPECHLTWLIRPKWVALLEGNPSVDEVVPVERSFGASWSCTRNLRHPRIDLAIDFQGLIQTAILAAAAHPIRLLGFDKAGVREGFAARFYSAQVHAHATHVVDRNLELAQAAGAKNLSRVFPLPAGTPEGVLPDGKFILASPLAGWGSKEWPKEHWSELATRLNLPLVLNGPPGSEERLSQIQGAHVHISGIPGLIDATRRAHAVIGVDSGPMHLAAALGKPGIAIFGPTDPARNGPYGGSLRVLRVASATTTYSRSTEPSESMRAITPQSVADALSAVLATQPSARCSA
jgi:heptosyltransferase-1